MKSTLEQQLDAIKSRLAADIVFRIGGPDEIAKNDYARRIVMVPTTRTYQSGGVIGNGIRTLATVVDTVVAHIWGGTMGEVEELEDALVNAIVRALGQNYRPGDGDWIPKTSSTRGWVARQTFNFSRPIIREEAKAPIVGEMPIAGTIVTTV